MFTKCLSTPHAPLTFPEYSLRYLGRLDVLWRRSETSSSGQNATDSRTTALPGSHHAIDEREAALFTVPEHRRTAGMDLFETNLFWIITRVSADATTPRMQAPSGATTRLRAVEYR